MQTSPISFPPRKEEGNRRRLHAGYLGDSSEQLFLFTISFISFTWRSMEGCLACSQMKLLKVGLTKSILDVQLFICSKKIKSAFLCFKIKHLTVCMSACLLARHNKSLNPPEFSPFSLPLLQRSQNPSSVADSSRDRNFFYTLT